MSLLRSMTLRSFKWRILNKHYAVPRSFVLLGEIQDPQEGPTMGLDLAVTFLEERNGSVDIMVGNLASEKYYFSNRSIFFK